jgi:integral membrane protein (TIGR01906 family)
VKTQTASKWWRKAALFLLVALIPLTLLLGGLRLLLTDTFVHVEYRTPGFPPDSYGFELQDRLKWAQLALDYLLNDAGVDFLGDLEFETGEPVFNARELRHMQDVKRLTQIAMRAWGVSLVNVGLLFLALYFWADPDLAWEALERGALVTIIIMIALSVALAISFSFVFVGFHRIFFEGDTWLFRYSDTLIRLFPERFWRDTFIALLLATLGQAFLLRWLARWSREERSDGSGAQP